MTQLGLIKKFLDTVGMADCNPKRVPCNITPLGTNANGARHSEGWDYASAIGMLMYLAGNGYPKIQFSVHQCACFTHAPRANHTMAVKKIAHYLKGVLDAKQGLTFKAGQPPILDLFVDADYAGLWTYEDDQDPVCVKSRTGFVITLGGCPVHWSSKLQSEITLSTLEAEFIALAQAMRELLPMQRKYDEMTKFFKLVKNGGTTRVKSTIWEDNNGCISTCRSPVLSLQTRHIAVKYHFVRNFFSPSGFKDHPFKLEKIDTKLQKADIFTKGLSADTFENLRKLMCGW